VQYVDRHSYLLARLSLPLGDVPCPIEGLNLALIAMLILRNQPVSDLAQIFVSSIAVLAARNVALAPEMFGVIHTAKSEQVAAVRGDPAARRPLKPKVVTDAVPPKYRSHFFTG
jgi:hypothetical protein